MSEKTKEMEKSKEKKPKSKTRKIIEWVLTGLFAIVFIILGVGQVKGMIEAKNHYGQTIRFGYCTFVVQTESMEPDYMVGSAIITYYESFESLTKKFDAGEVVDVSFMDAYVGDAYAPSNPQYTSRTSPMNYVMTHRLQEYRIDTSKKLGEGRYTFIAAGINTKGINSREEQYQAFTEREYLGVVVSNSNVLGGIFQFMTSVWGLILILLVPAGYVVVVSVIDIFKAYDDNEDDNNSNNDNGGSDDGNKSSSVTLSEEDKKRLKEQLLQEMLDKAAANKKA